MSDFEFNIPRRMIISKSPQPIIGITMGDPCGIGPEVIAKSLKERSIQRLARFKIIGDYRLYSRYDPPLFKECSFIDLRNVDLGKRPPRKASRLSGQASLEFLNEAVDLIKKKEITCLVTAPVSKEAIRLSGRSFSGHTEYLADAFGISQVEMMFVSPTLKAVIATRHLPLNQVSKNISLKKVYDTLLLTHQALQYYFKVKRPCLAVCGLNPHAGEGGNLGKEEITTIIPAIQKARRRRIIVEGPFAADTLFYPGIARRFDAIIAMYHDQGLIPLKTLYFKTLVNLTLGLPFVRTSPAHGTAFDIAGQNKADPSSMSEAIKLAAGLSRAQGRKWTPDGNIRG